MNNKSLANSPLTNRITSAMTIALTLALSLVLLSPAPASSESSRDSLESRNPRSEQISNEIAWHKYEDGVKLAKDQDKQILIDFSTSWCGYCKKMDRETFTDAKVINYINENFIAIKIDGDSKREFEIDGFSTTEKRLTKEMYGVTGYPTFWFLESDGSKIGKQPGYQPAKGFLDLLAFVTERKYLENANAPDAKKGQ